MTNPVTVEKFAVGQSVRRLEDPRLVQGLGRYSDDVTLTREAYAVIVRSPHAHARIRGIDASAARSAPGVVAILTGADLAADGVGNMPIDGSRKRRDGSPAFATPRPALVRERVRHVGDAVALVVAETRRAGRRRRRAVAVDYDPLPAVAATAEAHAPGRARRLGRGAGQRRLRVGGRATRDAVAHAFASAAHVTRLDFVVTRVAAAPLEPRAAVGEYDRRAGRYTLHTGIQGPHGLRTLLADVLHVPQSQVRVVTGEVGGSFGMRSGIYPELVLVLWAAKRLGRPVKWTSDRREGFVTDEHGRDNVSTAELALDADGKFLALRVAITLNIGAYFTQRSAGPGTNNVGGIAGVYTTPAIHVQTTGVYSNTTPTGPVPRRRPARGHLRHRARHRRGRARARDRPAGAAPPQSDPGLGHAVQDRPRLHLRLRRLRPRHGHGAGAGRPGRVRAAAQPRPGRAASCAGSASPTPSRSPAAPTRPSTPTPQSPGQRRRLRLPLHRLDVDGTGQRDGLHPDRQRAARPATRAHPGVLGRQRRPRRRPRQRRLGRPHRGRLGGDARHREGGRARPPHRGPAAGGRAGGRRAPRRPLHAWRAPTRA